MIQPVLTYLTIDKNLGPPADLSEAYFGRDPLIIGYVHGSRGPRPGQVSGQLWPRSGGAEALMGQASLQDHMANNLLDSGLSLCSSKSPSHFCHSLEKQGIIFTLV